MALYSLYCAEVPLRNCSLTHSLTATNYFIVSLAVADIMVAVLVMPLAVYVEVCLVIINTSSVV